MGSAGDLVGKRGPRGKEWYLKMSDQGGKDRAPSTCDRQASQTHSWGSCIYDSHFLCHFTVTWETRGAGSLGAPSFRRGQNERECGRTQWRGGASILNCPAPDIFFREEKKGLENCKYTGQRWNRAQDIGLGSGQAIL